MGIHASTHQFHSVFMYTYKHWMKLSYLASFLCLHCEQLASLYCHASLGYWYNKKSSFLEQHCRLFGLQIMKRWTLTNNTELILANKIFSYLPTNWLDKLKDVNWDSITNEGSILYTKSILHTQPNSRAWDILHTSSFTVGQCIQESIATETIAIFVSSSCIYYHEPR